jgi:hypothetical protein
LFGLLMITIHNKFENRLAKEIAKTNEIKDWKIFIGAVPRTFIDPWLK